MKIKSFCKLIEQKYPLELAYDWDNVGLLIGDYNKQITKVLCCLDVSDKAIEYALDNKVDLIIAHHPLIFRPIKSIRQNDIVGRKILKLIKNDMSVYAAHTNLDSAKEGLNEYYLSKLNLDFDYANIEYCKDKPLRIIKLKKEAKLKDIAENIKKEFSMDTIRLICEDMDTKIKKIALVTGSGMDFMHDVKDKVDLFLTADIKHHEALDAMDFGLSLIEIGHYESEIISIKLLSRYIKENTELEVLEYEGEKVFKNI